VATALLLALASCAPVAGPQAVLEPRAEDPEAPAPATPLATEAAPLSFYAAQAAEIRRDEVDTPAPSCYEPPKRAVDEGSVRVVATRTTKCKVLPTQSALADLPDYLVETECPAPKGFAKLHVVSEDVRVFFAVERAAPGSSPVPLEPFSSSFSDVAGPARWYAELGGPPSVVVIPIDFQSTTAEGEPEHWRVVAAWDLANGALCRTENASVKDDLAVISATLALRALEGACTCRPALP